MSETQEMTTTMTSVTTNHFLRRLEERVSGYNAKLLLHSAIVDSGIESQKDEKLNSEEAKNLCLSLIKRGGPAFQVGQTMYRELSQ